MNNKITEISRIIVWAIAAACIGLSSMALAEDDDDREAHDRNASLAADVAANSEKSIRLWTRQEWQDEHPRNRRRETGTQPAVVNPYELLGQQNEAIRRLAALTQEKRVALQGQEEHAPVTQTPVAVNERDKKPARRRVRTREGMNTRPVVTLQRNQRLTEEAFKALLQPRRQSQGVDQETTEAVENTQQTPQPHAQAETPTAASTNNHTVVPRRRQGDGRFVINFSGNSAKS